MHQDLFVSLLKKKVVTEYISNPKRLAHNHIRAHTSAFCSSARSTHTKGSMLLCTMALHRHSSTQSCSNILCVKQYVMHLYHVWQKPKTKPRARKGRKEGGGRITLEKMEMTDHWPFHPFKVGPFCLLIKTSRQRAECDNYMDTKEGENRQFQKIWKTVLVPKLHWQWLACKQSCMADRHST